MRRVTVGAGALLLCGLVLSGCVQTPEPSPTPTPERTFECTPEAGGDAYPCDQTEYDRMNARLDQYREAERIYRRVTEITFALLAEKKPMSDELRALVSGSYEDGLAQELVDAQSSKAAYSGQPTIAWIYRAPDIANEGSVIAIEACSEVSSLRVTLDGVDIPLPATQEQLFFTVKEGSLLLTSSKVAEVEKC